MFGFTIRILYAVMSQLLITKYYTQTQIQTLVSNLLVKLACYLGKTNIFPHLCHTFYLAMNCMLYCTLYCTVYTILYTELDTTVNQTQKKHNTLYNPKTLGLFFNPEKIYLNLLLVYFANLQIFTKLYIVALGTYGLNSQLYISLKLIFTPDPNFTQSWNVRILAYSMSGVHYNVHHDLQKCNRGLPILSGTPAFLPPCNVVSGKLYTVLHKLL